MVSPPDRPAPQEGHVPVARGRLFVREVGRGRPVLVLHGGPDFDHRYLLPDMDRLSDAFHLVFYDQRGRGRSAAGVRPEDVGIESEVADLERLREHFGWASVAVLGHSWGGLLAMEYAVRHPGRVSRLILMNTAPASRDDWLLVRRERAPGDVEELQALAAGTGYREGDPQAVADYYRVYFRATLRPKHLDQVIESLHSSFTREGILKARAIEHRLLDETWWASGYDLLPELGSVSSPALVLHGERDFIPVACAEHVAQALPDARIVVVRDCGHFAYLERPDEAREEIGAFLSR